MNAVFLDTVGLLALWSQDDQWHQQAWIAFEKIISSRQIVVTSPYVLLECANAASRRPYRNDLIQFRDTLLPAGGIIEPTQNEVEEAWAKYRSGDRTAPGVIDLLSFSVMRRLNLRQPFTNDRHFRTAGFQTLF